MGFFSFLSGKSRIEESALKSLAVFNWRESDAHRQLLTKFISPSSTESFVNQNYWEIALGENPSMAITRFQNEGLLVEPSLEEKVGSGFSSAEFKAHLKARNLKVSGNKDELAARLVQFDSDGMQKAVAERTFFVCSDIGMGIAKQIKTRNEEDKERAEQELLTLLGGGKLIEACRCVAQYEAKRAFPRGVNMDWKNYDPAQDVVMLKEIFSGNPKILARFDGQVDELRVPAAMMQLWGSKIKPEWLSPELIAAEERRSDELERLNNDGIAPVIDADMDVETAVRMLLFYAKHRVEMDNYRKLDFVKHIKILATDDSCEACKKLSKKTYKLGDVPELPHEHCTHERGCRCVAIA
jgi:hypothetical protein